jgi:tripartite motif-containing protein 71
MNKGTVIKAFVAIICAAPAYGGYAFAGKWGSYGTGPGEFSYPVGVAVAPNGNIYVADGENERIQYFTPTGSFLGKWSVRCNDVAVAANGNVYVTGPPTMVRYFTPTGSLLGWYNGERNHDFLHPNFIDITPKGDFLVTDSGTSYVHRFSRSCSLKYSWNKFFLPSPAGLACSPVGERVYIADSYCDSIMCFTYDGDLLASWGSRGNGNGEFKYPAGLGITADGTIFVADTGNDRVQYFTAKGAFLGKWGSYGAGNGEFDYLIAVAARPSGSRVYVADTDNHRIQYFNRNEPSVAPASLGKVKALFR